MMLLTDGDAGVDVGGAIQGIEHHDVVAGRNLLNGHRHVLLLRWRW